VLSVVLVVVVLVGLEELVVVEHHLLQLHLLKVLPVVPVYLEVLSVRVAVAVVLVLLVVMLHHYKVELVVLELHHQLLVLQ
jgi:hypothetical protein